MDQKGTVGFIGLGTMGQPMSLNLVKAGYPVVAYNRTRSKAEALDKEGVQIADSPREVAQRALTVIVMVSDSPDVEQVVLGKEGVIEGVQAGSVVIDMSTISPAATRHIGAKLAEKGAQMLDAPVSGSSWAAIDGTLAIMVGGKKEVFERSLPVLQAMGKKIIHIGPNGMGQVAKLVNQVIVAGTLAAVCEGLLLGAKAGVDLDKAFQAVTGGRRQLLAVGEPGRPHPEAGLRAGLCREAHAQGPTFDQRGRPGHAATHARVRRGATVLLPPGAAGTWGRRAPRPTSKAWRR